MNLHSRRDVLAAFLGLPLALASCSGQRGRRTFAGEIVGPSEALGHRLRDGYRPTPPPENWQRVGVVIVGGGIAGLSAAYRLHKAGFNDFALLELEQVAGGTSRSDENSYIRYPWGAHYIPAPMKENRLLVGLLDEMGILDGRDKDGEPVVAEQHLCRDPQDRLFFRGKWYEGLYLHFGETPEDVAQLRGFHAEIDRWVAWRDGKGRRAFAIPVAAGSDDPDVTALDRLSMADWLDQRGFTSRRLRWYVDYACRDDYGSSIEHTSAWAGVFYFASRRPKPGADAEPLITWPEGNGRVVAYLLERVKERVRLGTATCEIIPTDADGKKGVDVVALDTVKDQVIGFHADQVVFAAPHYLSSYLIRPYRTERPGHVHEFEYGAWMVANVSLKDRPTSRGFPLCWDNVFYDSPSLGYVVATHQRGLDFGPTVFTYYYPLCDASARDSRTRLQQTDWAGWSEVVLAELRRAHPGIEDLVERLDVMRWGHAMVRPRPGFMWSAARTKAAQPYRAIHFANSDLSGIGLFEEAHYHGVRAAEEVLTAREMRFESLLGS